MMTLTLIAAAMLVQDGSRREWEGFAEGSFAALRHTQTDGAKQESEVRKYTVLKVEADKATLRVESGQRAREMPFNLKPDAGFRKVGDENVDVDGRTFPCAVWEKTAEKGGRTQTVREWLHKDIPGRVARIEIATKTAGSELRGTGRIARLDQRLVVGGKTVTYAVYEFSGRGSDGREMTAVRWISESVPGFTVREETRMKGEVGREIVAVSELLEFEVK